MMTSLTIFCKFISLSFLWGYYKYEVIYVIKLKIILEPSPDGGFTVYVPSLPQLYQ
jgi:hypothetical protein